MHSEENFEMVAKTFQGLEDVLRDELISLGAKDVEMGCRMVSFTGDKELLYKANLCCRTALRILKPIVKFKASDPDELYDAVRDFEWDKFMGPDKTFSIDSTVNSSEFTHSRYVTYRVKDGIVDYFNDKYHKRPSIRLTGADIQLNVHISDDRVTISLDSSGEPLNKRGYRVEQTEAPINEVLAAGIILKTGWRGDCDFVDPMCGSGTFLIEAALIAANINPGIFRTHYAFETWEDFDDKLFSDLYNDDSEERTPGCRIYGGDIARVAVAVAQKNIEAAGVEEYVTVECKPFSEWTNPPEDGILVTNPPYGERIKSEDIEGLYRSIGSTLKNYFKGYHAWLIGYRDENFREIGLKPSVKFPILNGALECELREYVLFEGSYSQFREDGGSVANQKFAKDSRPKVRRMTDKEWDTEARKFGGKSGSKSHSGGHNHNKERGFNHKNREFGPKEEDYSYTDRDFKSKNRDSAPKEKKFKSNDRDFRERENGYKERKGRFSGNDRDFNNKGDFKGRNFTSSKPRRDRGVTTDTLGKKPSLPESSATVFDNRRFRPRKNDKGRNSD